MSLFAIICALVSTPRQLCHTLGISRDDQVRVRSLRMPLKPPKYHSLRMLRGKCAIIRIACVSVLSVMVCVFISIIHLSAPSALSLWNNFRPAPLPNRSRVCPDPNNPKYFEELAKSAGVTASRQCPLHPSSACHSIQKNRNWN